MPIYLFLSKTLQEIEIHFSVLLIQPDLQNLMNTDQMVILRYVENLLLQYCSCVILHQIIESSLSTVFFLYKYIFIIHTHIYIYGIQSSHRRFNLPTLTRRLLNQVGLGRVCPQSSTTY